MKNSRKIELNMKNKCDLAYISNQVTNSITIARAVTIMQNSYIYS